MVGTGVNSVDVSIITDVTSTGIDTAIDASLAKIRAASGSVTLNPLGMGKTILLTNIQTAA